MTVAEDACISSLMRQYPRLLWEALGDRGWVALYLEATKFPGPYSSTYNIAQKQSDFAFPEVLRKIDVVVGFSHSEVNEDVSSLAQVYWTVPSCTMCARVVQHERRSSKEKPCPALPWAEHSGGQTPPKTPKKKGYIFISAASCQLDTMGEPY